MGIDFGKLLGDAVKEVTGFVDRASKDITKAIDQNGDGKLDISDIQTVLDRNQAAQAENQRKADLERLKPVFQEDFKEDEFVLPKMVQVAVIDKAHADSAACKGSVGYKSVMDDMTVVTIFRENIDDFGLTFYPELENGVYYDITSSTLHTLAVTYYKKIPYRTEYEKKDIVIPETITRGTTTYTVTAIGDYAFEKTSVNSVQLPNTIVSIGKNAFYDCSNITEIALPSSVSIIA